MPSRKPLAGMAMAKACIRSTRPCGRSASCSWMARVPGTFSSRLSSSHARGILSTTTSPLRPAVSFHKAWPHTMIERISQQWLPISAAVADSDRDRLSWSSQSPKGDSSSSASTTPCQAGSLKLPSPESDKASSGPCVDRLKAWVAGVPLISSMPWSCTSSRSPTLPFKPEKSRLTALSLPL